MARSGMQNGPGAGWQWNVVPGQRRQVTALPRQLLDMRFVLQKWWPSDTFPGISTSLLPAARLALACTEAITAVVEHGTPHSGNLRWVSRVLTSCYRAAQDVALAAASSRGTTQSSTAGAAPAQDSSPHAGLSYAELVRDPCYLPCLFRLPLLALGRLGPVQDSHQRNIASPTARVHQRLLQLLKYHERLPTCSSAVGCDAHPQQPQPAKYAQFQPASEGEMQEAGQANVKQFVKEYHSYCMHMQEPPGLPARTTAALQDEAQLLVPPLLLTWAAKVKPVGQELGAEGLQLLYDVARCCFASLQLYRHMQQQASQHERRGPVAAALSGCSSVLNAAPGNSSSTAPVRLLAVPQVAGDVVLSALPRVLQSLSQLLPQLSTGKHAQPCNANPSEQKTLCSADDGDRSAGSTVQASRQSSCSSSERGSSSRVSISSSGDSASTSKYNCNTSSCARCTASTDAVTVANPTMSVQACQLAANPGDPVAKMQATEAYLLDPPVLTHECHTGC